MTTKTYRLPYEWTIIEMVIRDYETYHLFHGSSHVMSVNSMLEIYQYLGEQTTI